MRALVILEHDGTAIRPGSFSAGAFAQAVAQPGSVEFLLLGHNVESMAQTASRIAPVLVAEHELLATPVADRYANIIAKVVRSRGFDVLVAASTTFTRDI